MSGIVARMTTQIPACLQHSAPRLTRTRWPRWLLDPFSFVSKQNSVSKLQVRTSGQRSTPKCLHPGATRARRGGHRDGPWGIGEAAAQREGPGRTSSCPAWCRTWRWGSTSLPFAAPPLGPQPPGPGNLTFPERRGGEGVAGGSTESLQAGVLPTPSLRVALQRCRLDGGTGH